MNLVEPIAGKAKTGIWGLDNNLSGGFARGPPFLVEGAPGTSKTTVALQFRLEGVKAGEKCLHITLSETERELRDGAAIDREEMQRNGKLFVDQVDAAELSPGEFAHRVRKRVDEYRIDSRGLTAGESLDGFQGLLRGVPIHVGERRPLLREQSE